ncbi:hypothetical protein [Shewanella xiamenensis]|uniref:hypothetical protein n=1 Tax=Shewanella xiamenensis TaxID=332186 RepID=UPI001CC748E2|nr:hypothetical protein [Shewanella xiamenensis]BDA60557.1 hypothetical protein NUITMVS1_20200 [Shewanella xiamenensis]
MIYFLAAILVIKMFSLEAIKDNLSFLIIYCSLSTALFIWSIKAARLLLALYVNNEQLRKQSLQHQLSFRVGLYTAIPATLLITLGPEESPDDLQINHQIRVEAHLVA